MFGLDAGTFHRWGGSSLALGPPLGWSKLLQGNPLLRYLHLRKEVKLSTFGLFPTLNTRLPSPLRGKVRMGVKV